MDMGATTYLPHNLLAKPFAELGVTSLASKVRTIVLGDRRFAGPDAIAS
jgi:hypothetical protein